MVLGPNLPGYEMPICECRRLIPITAFGAQNQGYRGYLALILQPISF
jgi:hypothetical protein